MWLMVSMREISEPAVEAGVSVGHGMRAGRKGDPPLKMEPSVGLRPPGFRETVRFCGAGVVVGENGVPRLLSVEPMILERLLAGGLGATSTTGGAGGAGVGGVRAASRAARRNSLVVP